MDIQMVLPWVKINYTEEGTGVQDSKSITFYNLQETSFIQTEFWEIFGELVNHN